VHVAEDARLIEWSSIKSAIAQCEDIKVMGQMDYSLEAIQKWAKQSKQSLETQNEIAEYRLRLNRKQGEWIEANIPEEGAMGIGPVIATKNSYISLSDAGIDRNNSPRFRILARMPEGKFEEIIAQTKAKSEELTSKGVLALAIRIKRREAITNTPPFPEGKYQVIYADPPWQYDNTGLGGSAESHYPTLSTTELEELEDSTARQVTDLPGDNAVLLLWATAPFAPDGLQLCEAWGFEYKTHFVWIKDKATYGKLGFYVYSQHELLLVATKGSCLPQEGSLVSSVIVAPKQDHSSKPDLVYEIIEKMYPGPYIELFARKRRAGWGSWGTL
jgi:N6-adenosine-specific RNA methylase IME4